MYNAQSKSPYIFPDEFTLEGFNYDTLNIIPFDDPRLTTAPPDFDFEKDGKYAVELAEGLFRVMRRLGGVGLSANQLGLPYRVFVFGDEATKLFIFNPKIVGVHKDMVAMKEGCLSLPNFFLTIQRPKEVAASYQDVAGEMVVSNFAGLGARIFLHEYDHMEGLLFTQHASKFKIDWEVNKLKKKTKKFEQAKKAQLKQIKIQKTKKRGK